MKKVLWISFYLPYDSVGHAGGQIENYYIKGLNSNENYKVDLLTFATEDELVKNDLDKYGINYNIAVHHYKGISHLFWGILSRINRWNIWDKTGGMVSPFAKNRLKNLIDDKKLEGYSPDIIILQWTQAVLYFDYVQKVFPNTPIVCIEEDVAFLNYERRYKNDKVPIRRQIRKKLYMNLRKSEVEQLKKSVLVVNNNEKDYKLLSEYGVAENTWVWSPYFNSMLEKEYVGASKDIVFYGAMNRYENWKSAIWFIENVWPLINDDEMRFVVVGNKPPEQLLKYKSNRIIITGFVDDVSLYLQEAYCLVAPLILGAGVKIKIIEAMSMGLPVLTNHIGIEGIDAVNEREFFLCETPSDYVNAIDKLRNRQIAGTMSKREKELIEAKYNYSKSLREFIEKISAFCRRNQECK